MAGFLYSYRQCTSMNLHNIYSGNEREPRSFVMDKKVDRYLERRQLLRNSLAGQKKDYVKRTYNKRLNYYDKDLGIHMPKAPAFRETDPETVYEIVQRLNRPESARVYNRPGEPSELASRRVKSATQKSPLTENDVDMIFSRLYVTHTHVSRVKSAKSRQPTVYMKDGRYVLDETNNKAAVSSKRKR